MCSISKFSKGRQSNLELADYELLAEQGRRLGAIALTILGGEPLLSNNLEEIIKIFKKRHFFIYIVSNGMLATEQRLRDLRSCGLDSICFSLDSMSDEQCFKIRGIRNYVKRALEAVSAAQRAGLIVNLAPVFFHNKIEDGIEVIEYCKKHNLGASGGQVAAVGGAQDNELLSQEEHDRIRSLLKYYPRLTFDWALSYFLRVECPAGKEKIAVTSTGEIVGCSVNPISFGNIRQEPLGCILERMQGFSQFAKNSRVCLAAEDRYYCSKYLKPLKDFSYYPVSFREHPNINRDEEPALFSKSIAEGQ